MFPADLCITKSDQIPQDNKCGRSVFLWVSPTPSQGSGPSAPIFWGTPGVSRYRLTQNDQIRHGKTCGRGVSLWRYHSIPTGVAQCSPKIFGTQNLNLLAQRDEIRHDNTYAKVHISWG